MIDLNALGNFPRSQGLAINNAGQVLLRVYESSGGGKHEYYLYRDGQFTNLSALPELRRAGWAEIEFTGLDDQGQVTGRGIIDRYQRGFILRPRSAQ
jgi:hypothetical protein